MFWYLVICVLMMYPLSVRRAGSVSGKKTQQLALLLSCLILWFFMAMRHVSVGVDTKYYSYVFTQFPATGCSTSWSASSRPRLRPSPW